jgi:hypothetical protein
LKVFPRRHVALTCERAHDLLIDPFPPDIQKERRIACDNLDFLSKDLRSSRLRAEILGETTVSGRLRPIREVRTTPALWFVRLVFFA